MRIYWSFRNLSLILGLFCYLSSVSQEIICKDNTKLSKEKELLSYFPDLEIQKKEEISKRNSLKKRVTIYLFLSIWTNSW